MKKTCINLPKLSLEVRGRDIYPLIVDQILKLTRGTRETFSGGFDTEDYLSEATLQVLKLDQRTAQVWVTPSTFVYPRIRGAYVDSLRRQKNMFFSERRASDCPNGTLPDSNGTFDLEKQINNARLFRRVATVMRRQLNGTEIEIVCRVYLGGETLKTVAADLWLKKKDAEFLLELALRKVRENFPESKVPYVA